MLEAAIGRPKLLAGHDGDRIKPGMRTPGNLLSLIKAGSDGDGVTAILEKIAFSVGPSL